MEKLHLSKNKYCFTIYFLLVLCFSSKAQCNRSYSYAYKNTCSTITIEQFNSKKLTENCYNVMGYISHVSHFHKCPKNAICKMSPPATLYISDKYRDRNNSSRMSINLPFDKEDEFKEGDYGIFSFMNRRSNNPEHINMVNNLYNLIGYEILRLKP